MRIHGKEMEMKRYIMRTGAWTVALAVLFGAGCGKAKDAIAEKAIETMAKNAQGGGKVDVKVKDGQVLGITSKKDGENVSMTVSKDGNNVEVSNGPGGASMTMGDTAKIPGDFPKDVPVYAGLKVGMSSNDPNEGSFLVQGTTPDTVDKVAAFYAKAMKDGAWTETLSMKQPEMQSLAYEKDTRAAQVMLTKADAGTTVMLTVAKK